jgi:excisionase family DNA binding protein
MKLLTPEACAEMLAVSRSTVLRMIADGALPAVMLRSGRRKKVWRVREEVLEKWVKERETRQPGKVVPISAS